MPMRLTVFGDGEDNVEDGGDAYGNGDGEDAFDVVDDVVGDDANGDGGDDDGDDDAYDVDDVGGDKLGGVSMARDTKNLGKISALLHIGSIVSSDTANINIKTTSCLDFPEDVLADGLTSCTTLIRITMISWFDLPQQHFLLGDGDFRSSSCILIELNNININIKHQDEGHHSFVDGSFVNSKVPNSSSTAFLNNRLQLGLSHGVSEISQSLHHGLGCGEASGEDAKLAADVGKSIYTSIV